MYQDVIVISTNEAKALQVNNLLDMLKEAFDHNLIISLNKISSYIAWYPILETAQITSHVTPWQNCSFTLHPQQTCSFTLHPLVDLFLYTSPTGRPVPLHITPQHTCSFTLHPLTDLFLYTSLPGRPVPLHFTP